MKKYSLMLVLFLFLTIMVACQTEGEDADRTLEDYSFEEKLEKYGAFHERENVILHSQVYEGYVEDQNVGVTNESIIYILEDLLFKQVYNYGELELEQYVFLDTFGHTFVRSYLECNVLPDEDVECRYSDPFRELREYDRGFNYDIFNPNHFVFNDNEGRYEVQEEHLVSFTEDFMGRLFNPNYIFESVFVEVKKGKVVATYILDGDLVIVSTELKENIEKEIPQDVIDARNERIE